MGISGLDITMHGIIVYGLEYIRKHLDETIEEIFADYRAPHLSVSYGDKEIQKIKTFIKENDIPVKLAWALDEQDVPCYSLHLSEDKEYVEKAFMGDHGGVETEEGIEPRIIVPWFVPTSYDNTVGTLLVPDEVDTTYINAGHIIKDKKGEEYRITSVTDQEITIDVVGSLPDLAKVLVTSFVNYRRRKRGEVYCHESIDIGVHGHGFQNTVLWLYSILKWILLRFKSLMEERCLQLTTFSGSDFKRDSQYLPENIFTRWMRLSAITRMSWTEEPYDEVDTLVVETETCEGGDHDC